MISAEAASWPAAMAVATEAIGIGIGSGRCAMSPAAGRRRRR